MSIYDLLEAPLVYRLAQAVLAPGMDRIVTARLTRMFASIPRPDTLLDVGCGPASWLWKLGLRPTGLDLCHAYTIRFRRTGNRAVTASCARLPFPASYFDVVFSYGLVHHLAEEMAREALIEMLRVTRINGHVILFDPVLPRFAVTRPLAWALCKLDRGRFIRPQGEYETHILRQREWRVERFTHSYLGTEGVFSVLKKVGDAPRSPTN